MATARHSVPVGDGSTEPPRPPRVETLARWDPYGLFLRDVSLLPIAHIQLRECVLGWRYTQNLYS